MKEELYIKETLLDYESPMDMDAIWSDLDKALDKAESGIALPPAIESQKTSPARKYLPLLLLLLVSGCGFYAYKNLSLFSGTPTATEVDPVQLNTESQKKASDNTNTSETTPDSYETKSVINQVSGMSKTTNKTQSTPQKAASKGVIISRKKQATQPSSTTSPNFAKATNADRSITPPPTANKTSPNYSHSHNNEVVAAPIQSESSQKKSNLPLASPTPLEGLAIFNSDIIPLHYTRTVNPDFVFAKVARSRKIVPEKENRTWRLGLHTGIVSAMSDVTIEGMSASGLGDFSDSKTINAQRLSQPTFGVQVERIFPTGLLLRAGLNYLNQGRNIISVDTLGTEEMTFTSLSAPATNQFGMTSVTSTVTTIIETTIAKEETQENLILLQVPLTVGYQKAFSKIDMGVAAGLGLNYVLEQQTFNIAVAELINPLRLPTLSLSGLIDLELGYALSENFRIYASAFGGRHLSSKFINPESDLSSNAKSIVNHYGLRAGISFVL